MIVVNNLVKTYGDVVALDQLCLRIRRGAVFGLLGPNGAGKTTLISILNGLLSFDRGTVTVAGLDLKKNIKQIRQRCAFIPQSLSFYDKLTVLENMQFFAGIQKIRAPALRRNLDRAVAVCRLQSLLSQRASTLSGGQKRRLNIGIGLLNDPDILFFDEPTVGIDPKSRNDILDTIQSFKMDNKTVVYTSHYLQEIERICDEVAIIDKGRIVLQGMLADLLASENGDAVVVELARALPGQVQKLARTEPKVQFLDENSFVYRSQAGESAGELCLFLEKMKLRPRRIQFGSTDLETLFMRLTAEEAPDV